MTGDLRPCHNPACVREVGGGALYCCGGCARAHVGGFDPDSYHSQGCDLRHAQRHGDPIRSYDEYRRRLLSDDARREALRVHKLGEVVAEIVRAW